MYGMAAMDDRGRIADRSVMTTTLGWSPGTVVEAAVDRGTLVITSATTGSMTITAQGFLRLPAPIRHQLGLRPGDRVLLAGDPYSAQLRLYPPATLDALLRGFDHEADGGVP